MSRFDFSRPLPFRRTRTSTYARDGSNSDQVLLEPEQSWAAVFENAGEILHLWMTVDPSDESVNYLSDLRILMWFDQSPIPQVNLPMGHLFGLGHAELSEVRTMAFDVSKCGKGNPAMGAFNFWLPMPFQDGARIEFRNQGSCNLSLGAYIDAACYIVPESIGTYRFHATHRLGQPELPDVGENEQQQLNTTGEDNYVLLNVENGEGSFVGSILSVESTKETHGEWYEGDDMIFIDGASWPPALHGTGTEDYFNMAEGISSRFSGMMHGISQCFPEDETDHAGRFCIYRLHTLDPVPFRKSIKATLEHGHSNTCNAKYQSIALWYGTGHDSSAEEVYLDRKAKFGNPGII